MKIIKRFGVSLEEDLFLVNKSLSIQHEFSHIILATQHVHLDRNSCLEIIALKGKAENLKVLPDKLIALKGIKHGKLVMN